MKIKLLVLSVLSFLTIAIFISTSCVAQQQTEGGWLWKISGNGMSQPSYLFGTYHGTFDILYGYVDSIPGFREAFNTCSHYVGEAITPDDMKSVFSELDIKMPRDTTYVDLLNEEEYHFLDSIVLEHFKAPLNNMFLKPSYLGIFLGKINERKELKKAGYSENWIDSITSQVMDFVLEKKAREKGYTHTGLETIAEQMDRLIPFGNDLKKQATELINMLREDDDYAQLESLSKNLPEVYRSQSIRCLIDFEEKMDSLYQSSTKLNEVGEYQRTVLLKRRNLCWMTRIPKLIKENPTFIAVGVRHLPGKFGLISLLQENGYKVEAISLK